MKRSWVGLGLVLALSLTSCTSEDGRRTSPPPPEVRNSFTAPIPKRELPRADPNLSAAETERLKRVLPEKAWGLIEGPGVLVYFAVQGPDRYVIYREGLMWNHGSCGPIGNTNPCVTTADKLTYGPGHEKVVSGKRLRLPSDPEGRVVYRDPSIGASIGIKSPGACARVERWAPYYECRQRKVVYVGDESAE